MKIIIILILFTLFITPVQALTPTQHMSVSLILEPYLESNLQAFIAGFISHAITDMIELHHYNFNLLNPTVNDIDIILLEGLLGGHLLYINWDNEKKRYAILGSLAPDIIDGIFTLINSDNYYKGDHLFFWHNGNNKNKLNKEQTIVLTVVSFSITF